VYFVVCVYMYISYILIWGYDGLHGQNRPHSQLYSVYCGLII
jgi:hypothetical protein